MTIPPDPSKAPSKLNVLRAELDKGIQSLDAGRGRELDVDEFLAEKRSSGTQAATE